MGTVKLYFLILDNQLFKMIKEKGIVRYSKFLVCLYLDIVLYMLDTVLYMLDMKKGHP